MRKPALQSLGIRCLLMIAAVLIVLILAGCEKKKLTTVVLQPDSKQFVYAQRGLDDAGSMPDSPLGVPCPAACFYDHGTACLPGLTADDSTLVGYSHSYDDGTSPCRCWWYVNCVYRGYVGFDVQLPTGSGLVSAILKWDPSTRRSSGSTATNIGNCIAKVYRATEPWQTNQTTAGEQIAWAYAGETDPAPSKKDVSTIVRGWVTGTMPNYGFFFVGPNEGTNIKDNDECLTTLENLRLEMVVSTDL